MFFNKIRMFFKRIFSVTFLDSHIMIYFLGLRIRKKIKTKVDLPELSDNCLNKEARIPKIILSLTSFPQRINTVSKTIITLLNQSIKADEVVLWLAEEQFPKKEDELPKELLDLREKGLSIKWTHDTRSYKKLIPSLKEYPNDIIITFDDDIYYPKNTVELLYNEYLKNPNYIYTNRSRRLCVKNTELSSRTPAEMYWIKFEDYSYLNKITGCGGVLYPPNSLSERVFDEEEFRRIIPTQDDVWFWAMAILKGTKIKQVAGFDIQLVTVENSQEFGLSKINVKSGKGIDSLEASKLIVKEYPELMEKLMEEKDV